MKNEIKVIELLHDADPTTQQVYDMIESWRKQIQEAFMSRHILTENYVHHNSVTIVMKALLDTVPKLVYKCNSCGASWQDDLHSQKITSCPNHGKPYEKVDS